MNTHTDYRLMPEMLAVWQAKRIVRASPNGERFPYPLTNARRNFIHTLNQWSRIGEANGNGNRAARRIRAMRRAIGPWLNWPEMTITAI